MSFKQFENSFNSNYDVYLEIKKKVLEKQFKHAKFKGDTS